MLAGKVNLEGELYLSKSIPYTIETLAIEFNRDVAQIKLALDIFIELEMLELTEANTYKVKNFVKHQNIKVKEKEIFENKETEAKNSNVASKEVLKPEIVKDKDGDDRTVKNREKSSTTVKGVNLEAANKVDDKVEDCIVSNSVEDRLQKQGAILLDTKKGRKKNRKKTDNLIDTNDPVEEFIDEEIIEEEADGFIDGDIPLGKDESIVLAWSFG